LKISITWISRCERSNGRAAARMQTAVRRRPTTKLNGSEFKMTPTRRAFRKALFLNGSEFCAFEREAARFLRAQIVPLTISDRLTMGHIGRDWACDPSVDEAGQNFPANNLCSRDTNEKDFVSITAYLPGMREL